MQDVASTVVNILIGAGVMGVFCLWLVYKVTKKERGPEIVCHVCGQKLPANADMSDFMLSTDEGVLYALSRKPLWVRREEASRSRPSGSPLAKKALAQH